MCVCVCVCVSTAPGVCVCVCPLLQVCVHLDGLNAENTFHCWLYSIIVYVMNKAHLS